jgi:hypothetical protein
MLTGINEPHDLWLNHIDPTSDRGIWIGNDPEGSERLYIGGKPSRYFDAEILSRGRSMGSTFEERIRSKYRIKRAFPLAETIRRTSSCSIWKGRESAPYPTLALEWAETEDPT